MTETSWAPDPAKQAYTWTFNKNALLMRYFLWLYEADQKSMTFCRFFWGMVCSPVALPIRLAKGAVRLTITTARLSGKGIVTGVGWVGSRSTVKAVGAKGHQIRAAIKASRLAASSQRREADFKRTLAADAKKTALREARWQREAEERQADYLNVVLYGGVYQGLKPRRRSVQTKIADGAGEGVDKLVAWFQAHPKLLARTSKFITRCIFYPAAFIIPTGIVVGSGYEVVMHRHGGAGAIHDAWSEIVSGIALALKEMVGAVWLTLRVAGPPMLKVIAAGLGMTVLMVGSLWMMVKLDEHDRKKLVAANPSNWDGGSSLDAREAPDSLFLMKARASLDKRLATGGKALGAVGAKLAPVAKGAGHGFSLFGRSAAKKAARVGDAVATVAVAAKDAAVTGTVAVKRTGGFFATAHHAIKYRTCPRIEITE